MINNAYRSILEVAQGGSVSKAVDNLLAEGIEAIRVALQPHEMEHTSRVLDALEDKYLGVPVEVIPAWQGSTQLLVNGNWEPATYHDEFLDALEGALNNYTPEDEFYPEVAPGFNTVTDFSRYQWEGPGPSGASKMPRWCLGPFGEPNQNGHVIMVTQDLYNGSKKYPKFIVQVNSGSEGRTWDSETLHNVTLDDAKDKAMSIVRQHIASGSWFKE